MNEKVFIIALVLVVSVIGLFALVNLDSSTGGSIVERRCQCTITQYDFYGNAYGTFNQIVRVKTSAAHTDEACNNRCQIMFENDYTDRTHVYGSAI